MENKIEKLNKLERRIDNSEKILRDFQRMIINVFILLFILWVLFFLVLGITSAPTSDMHPKVEPSDLLLYYRLNKSPGINDIIVFQRAKTRYIGRVIAQSGDTIEITTKGGVILNGSVKMESNIYEETLPREGRLDYPLTLKENEYFILSDSRETGEDSRFFGPVKSSEIEGVVVGLFRRNNL